MVALAWLGLVGVTELLPRGADAPPLCHFRRLTGVECPTCGSTRAVRAVLAGDVLGAVAFNPLMMLILAGLVVWFVVRVIGRHRIVLEASPGWRRWSLPLFLGALLLNWGWVLWRPMTLRMSRGTALRHLARRIRGAPCGAPHVPRGDDDEAAGEHEQHTPADHHDDVRFV